MDKLGRSAREHRNEYMKLYMREWRKRKNSKEKIRGYNNRYWYKKSLVELRSLDVNVLEAELELLKRRACQLG